MIYDRISNGLHDKLLATLKPGAANALLAEDVATAIGIDGRTIRRVLEEFEGVLEDHGVSHIVCGGPRGYYLVETEDEYQEHYARLRRHALKELRRASAAKRAWKRRPLEQPAQPPVPEGYQFALLAA